MNGLAIAVIGATVIVFLYVRSYNRLVNDREVVEDSWATIETELARRHDLIPGLVSAVTAGAVRETRLIEALVRTERVASEADSTAAARSDPEHELAMAAAAVVALREQYPVLDSQRNFLRLQHELAITEDRLGAARRYYNMQVAELNRRVQAFPSSIVARLHGVTPAAYFDV